MCIITNLGDSGMETEAQKKANEKYKMKNDTIKFYVPKGRKKEIEEFAKSKGMSVTKFIVGLIDEAMEK